MKIQIIVDMNLVIIGDGSTNMDCSKFKEQFVFCEVNNKEKWIEKEPFIGKEPPEDWNEIEEFIDIAKLKSNQPNSYSVWNEDTKSWIEDIELKKEYENSVKKVEKERRLSSIMVTTANGNTFDGNETARNNMMSAVMSAELLNKTEEYWKLADNSIKLVSLDELKEALALSIQEVGNIVKDY